LGKGNFAPPFHPPTYTFQLAGPGFGFIPSSYGCSVMPTEMAKKNPALFIPVDVGKAYRFSRTPCTQHVESGLLLRGNRLYEH
jgi:hypothetical protein